LNKKYNTRKLCTSIESAHKLDNTKNLASLIVTIANEINDWYFFVLLLVRGYLEGALNRERSSGTRGGGSRWCGHEVGWVVDSKKLRAEWYNVSLTPRMQSYVNNSWALHYRSSATTRATVE